MRKCPNNYPMDINENLLQYYIEIKKFHIFNNYFCYFNFICIH